MKRLLLSLLLCAALLSASAPTVSALAADVSESGPALETRALAPTEAPQVTLNGTRLTLGRPPVIVDGCVMVPIRSFLDALGVSLEWNNSRKTILCWLGNTSVLLQLNVPRMARQVNKGNIVFSALDAAPFALGGQTMVPLAPLAEAFGYQAQWDEETCTMAVTQP